MVESTTNNQEEDKIYNNFPALSVTLDEIKHLFDLEESRRQSLENKAGILIGFLGVILTIVPLFSQEIVDELLLFYVFIIGSLVFALMTISLTKYKIPNKEFEDFYQYAKMESNEAMDQFLLNYIDSAEKTEKTNDSKVLYLKLSFSLIVLAGLFILGRAFYITYFI